MALALPRRTKPVPKPRHLPTTTTVAAKTCGPAPAGMTWDAKTGTWKPVGQVPYPTTTPVTPELRHLLLLLTVLLFLMISVVLLHKQAAVTAASAIFKLFPGTKLRLLVVSRDTGTAPEHDDKGLAIDVGCYWMGYGNW